MIKTAESVTIAHPDKVCDQISDAILDECLAQDPNTRSAVEVLGGHGIITITGELTTRARINIRNIAAQVYVECGYQEPMGITTNIVEQSTEIKSGVDREGAGDQGIMVGYATTETAELVPLELVLARKLTQAMGKTDGKAQVTVDNGKVISILTSVCNADYRPNTKLVQTVNQEILPIIASGLALKDIWLQNPNGNWTIGGFAADTGLTGRKLAVDNYGPHIPIGGGCFSGKDATKVDRSGAYIARKIAVDYLKRTGAREVYTHIAYAIGKSEPLMAVVALDGTQEKIRGYDLRPRAIIEYLDLRKPIFRQTASCGHFGRDFAWDR